MRKGHLSAQEYKRLVLAVYTRDGWKCRCCKSRENLTPHHVVFRSQGGKDTAENLITLCIRCHDAVHAGKLTLLGNDANSEIRFIPVKRERAWQRVPSH